MTARSMTMPILSILSLATVSSVPDLLRDCLWDVFVDIFLTKKQQKQYQKKKKRYPKHMLDISVFFPEKNQHYNG
jgi:hypothetical protein